MPNPYEPTSTPSETVRLQSREIALHELAKGFAVVAVFAAFGGFVGAANHVHAFDGRLYLGATVGALAVATTHVLIVRVMAACRVNLDLRFAVWNLPELIAIGLILTSPWTAGLLTLTFRPMLPVL